ncbi:MAG: 4'-phosphopantetheinyl transferase superfamily protein [Erysipelotrichaceae bacterium]|nr:4'-phosphopantetheinyl transferase superfamily protein [Alistipes sp.]MBQ1810391.1 4'-phosphopantetheinyl transferase superfamily protein [Erysipelotrichaceae bacterium]MBQ5756213.1 4'-phosphopantetheinyl transferase superfamily protein [Erysipelotrichaceae bacterium]
MNNEIYLLNCHDLHSSELFGKAFSVISEERRKVTDKYLQEEDKALSAGVGLLENYVRGKHPELAEILRDETEKPYFSDRRNFVSISHAGDYAMLGISEQPLGVDVEVFHNDHEIIIRHFFTADEKEYLDHCADRQKEFFELWSRKESYIKRNQPTDIRTFSVMKPEEGMEYLSYSFPGYSCVAYVDRSYRTVFQKLNISDVL